MPEPLVVPGLQLLAEYVSPAEEAALLGTLDAQPWRADLKRRVQHYGYRYDYARKTVGADLHLGPLPGWLGSLADRLLAERIFEARPDQAIVNEYQPGQGISAHVDCVPCFGPVVVSLTLGSGCAMELSDPTSGGRASHYLAPRSLLVLSGEARSRWRHAIPARRSDPQGPRGRRVSVTFRTVRLALA